MIFVPLPCLVFPTHAALFGYNERVVYVALREVYLPAFFEVSGQRFEYGAENSFFDPLLDATAASLVGRVAFWKVLPRSTGAQYTEDAVKNGARALPGSASSVFSAEVNLG